MNFLLINFVAGALVSFLGSLPVGILNVLIVQISLQKGLKSAFSFAFACAVIELGYSYIAVWMSGALLDFAVYKYPIQLFSIVVFLIAGIYYMRKKPAVHEVPHRLSPFSQGIVLSIINVIAIPFWLVYTSVLTTYHWIDISSGRGTVYFVAGISLGTVAGLMAFALLSQRINRRFSLQSSLVNKIVGLLLIGSSLLEIIDLII